MSKPMNWMLAGATAKKAVTRSLRNRLAATTILAVVPFLGYGREAYAICDTSSAPDITCTGTISGASITQNNANVTTVAPFTVTADGLHFDGDGDIRFTDNAGSSITNNNYGGTGLTVKSNGPDGDTPGSVTIITNATITGSGNGIAAYNYDSSETGGNLSITVNGDVTARDVDEPYLDDFIVNDGIHAVNSGNALTITTGAASTVTGEHNAIDARNYGRGDLTINMYGALTSNEYDGVFARNYKGAANLFMTVGAQSVIDGAGNGIQAQNFGRGNLDITVDGQVTGHGYDGIRALNVDGEFYNFETEETYFGDGVDLKITTGAQSIVRGDDNGIDARNYGTGKLDITANGYVTGDSFDGIYARNDGTDLTITTGVDSVVRGAGRGITANNYGGGALTVTANGWVGGYASEDGDGIQAYNAEDGSTLTITTGAESTVRGADDGIDASNRGDGGLTITANGVVRGEGDGVGGPTHYYGAGIRAYNGYGATEDEETGYFNALTITTGAGSQVTGQSYGIIGVNRGHGDFNVTANGLVVGKTASGISALNYEDGQDLIIETGSGSKVTGLGGDGIFAYQNGNGILDITVNGVATGKTDEYEDYDSFGIEAVNRTFFAPTYITVGAGGVAQGQEAGISSDHNGIGSNNIYNDGLVRNLSGESHDLAILAQGGEIYVQNNADIIGTVYLNSFNDPNGDSDPFEGKNTVMDNNSLWDPAGGKNYFGDGLEDTLNNYGVLLAADDSTTTETTTITGLELFNNNGGLVSLVDGKEGDLLSVSGTEGTKYQGNNGHLAVDTALAGGPGGLSDQFVIEGSAFGNTSIHVNVVQANGANLDGIPVVHVQDGFSDASTFTLDGPVNGGFFTWGLRFNDTNPSDLIYELYTLTDANGNPIPGGGAYEFPAGLAATQDIWLQTASTALQRQADLRSLLTGVGVTPVADFGEDIEPTPIEPRITPGFWFKTFASYAESDDEQNGFTLDRNQTTYGGMAGFDFGTQSVGDAMMFGIFGGYIASDLEFESTNSDWSYEGPTVGVYATYIDQSLYIDATVKADFLDINIDPDDLASAADDSDTDALNVGARIDAGYKFGHSLFIEPQASLAVVYTDIDDVDIFGGTVEFENETDVRGRLGMRVGVDHHSDDATVYSADVTGSVWEDFSGDTEVTVVDTGIPDFGVSDDAASTFGDVSLGLSVANPDGWSAFMRGNYLFADDYEAVAGSAGVRLTW